RQSGGRRLLSAFDPPEPAVPGAPRLVSAIRRSNGIEVNWLEPDNGGSPLTFYSILRGTASGSETPMQVIGPATPQYLDTTADPVNNQLTSINFGTGTFNTGVNGTVTVDVPLAAIGSPTIPVTDSNAIPAVRYPYGVTLAGEGPLLGGLVFFTQPCDRAPDS